MSKRIEEPSGAPKSGDPEDPESWATEDESLDGDLDADLAAGTDEEESGTDLEDDESLLDEEPDLDAGEDDEPGDEAPPPLEEDLDLHDEDCTTDEVDVWAILDEDRCDPRPPPPGMQILPWTLRAGIPALQIEVPTLLDPTRPDSVWIVPREPDREVVEILLQLGPIEVRAHLRMQVGEEPRIVLGRDVLAGRIAVRC